MLNHIRTLLRNTDYEPHAGTEGGELLDPSYRAVTLPGYLAAVRAVLFGRRPDRAGLDLKLRRYMALLHATGLENYITAIDPRVTYPAPIRDRLEFDFTSRVTPVGHNGALYLTGTPPAEGNGGALEYIWDLKIAGTELRIERQRPDAYQVIATITYRDGLADPIALIGSGLTVRFHAGAPDESGWIVTCLARPTQDLGDVLATLDIFGEGVDTLFGGAEPYVSWKRLWESPAPLPYRLGAVLLALAYRTDELNGGR